MLGVLGAHAAPHRPQLFMLVLVLTSQPLSMRPSQSPKPGLQVRTHAPVAHVAGWFVVERHVEPHMPQCSWLVRLCSQPLSVRESQLPKPGLHTNPHAPPAHVAVVLGAAAHRRPHIPQLFTSVCKSTQLAPHVVCMHEPTHVPFEQTWPEAQRLPQRPQWFTSVAVLDSHPLAALASQSAKPAAHVPTAHCPPAQRAAVTLASAHARPHIPQ